MGLFFSRTLSSMYSMFIMESLCILRCYGQNRKKRGITKILEFQVCRFSFSEAIFHQFNGGVCSWAFFHRFYASILIGRQFSDFQCQIFHISYRRLWLYVCVCCLNAKVYKMNGNTRNRNGNLLNKIFVFISHICFVDACYLCTVCK